MHAAWPLALSLSLGAPALAADAADAILHGGRVWTVDPKRPEADAVALRGGRILAVGSAAEVWKTRGPATEVIDVGGGLVLPGFIDAHTHFENAADWVFQVALYPVNTKEELVERLRGAAARIPEGLWLTGGDWGAYAAWDAARAVGGAASFEPDLAAVDAATPRNPVLVRRHDGAYFANSKALAWARVDETTADPRGGRFQRDPTTGRLTGMLYGRAAERIVHMVPPPTIERKLVGARQALRDLARHGITSIQDVARIDAVTQGQLFHTFVERSYSNMNLFYELRRRGELTVRVHPLLTLRSWAGLAAAGIRPGGGDDWIRYGTLKGFVDGSMMRQPLASDPRAMGNFTYRVKDEATMRSDIVAADAAGYDFAVHVLGDKAHGLLLDWYDAAIRGNPGRDRRSRLVHAWYPAPEDVRRAGAMRLIADITPQHLIEEIPTLEQQLGPERAARAFPWRSLIESGVRVNIVSDWPGAYNEQIPTPLSPLENIVLAVTRRPVDGSLPAWHPEQALTVREAVEAYTSNPAFAAREEAVKGSITEGKLADLVVLSADILRAPVAEIPKAEVLYTIVGGRIVYRKGQPQDAAARRGEVP